MSNQDIILLWIHGLACGAFIMNFYWGQKIRRLEQKLNDMKRDKP